MESVKDKVVLITGSSSGIGAATAVLFAKYGSRLVLNGRNEANLKNTADLCAGAGLSTDKIKLVTGDVTIDANLANIVDVAVSTFGGIDILVNCAGGGYGSGRTQTLNMDDFDNAYRTCLRSPVFLTKLVIPYLKKNKGSIVNVSSSYGVRPGPNHTSCSVMKAAVDMLTKDLALELAVDGIRVNAVSPGYIDTPRLIEISKCAPQSAELNQYLEETGSMHPLGRMGHAEEVAQSIVFLASTASSFTTGTILMVDGGITQKSPWTPTAK